MAVDGPVCANCGGRGAQACSGCRLVLYCDGDCQKSHWQEHKVYCRSPVMRSDWEPDWAKEFRMPAFLGPDQGHDKTKFGGKKFFIGNTPAFDLIQLAANEGEKFDGDLNLLFAASGDLRNVIKSMASLPSTYSGAVTTVINDLDFEIVARNTIMLLVALLSEDPTQTARIIIHLWYSAAIRKDDALYLCGTVRPMVEDVVTKIKKKASDAVCGKTWKINNSSLRVELTKESWKMLLNYFELPKDFSAQKAQDVRREITLAPTRKDYLHRRLHRQPPAHRVVDLRYRQDGIFAPFGYSRKDFTVPNTTFFQRLEWPICDFAEPGGGWSLPDVLKTNTYGATNDLHGKIYLHIQSLLTDFLSRLSLSACNFRMLNTDARTLPDRLKSMSFSRIETSNIADAGYLGVGQTVECLAPLLQTPQQNPHATLVTLFMNAIHETVPRDHFDNAELEKALQFLQQNLNGNPLNVMTAFPPMVAKTACAAAYFRDNDKYFDQYMKGWDFPSFERAFGVEIKKHHTIIEKWPMKLKLRFGEAGAQEEFDTLLSSCHAGVERYVEWKRKA